MQQSESRTLQSRGIQLPIQLQQQRCFALEGRVYVGTLYTWALALCPAGLGSLFKGLKSKPCVVLYG